jgi:rhodanese-related sulfurtransferase
LTTLQSIFSQARSQKFTGLNSPRDPMTTADANLPIEIDCRTVQALRATGEDILLIDCREADEYARVRIEGAMLIPLREMPQRADELAPHRRIVVHCHHGGRSLKAADWLRQNGFASAQSMAGGIDAWAIEIDPKLPRY